MGHGCGGGAPAGISPRMIRAHPFGYPKPLDRRRVAQAGCPKRRKAVRRLHPPLAQPATALCRVPGYGALVQLWRRVRATLPGVVCFEAMRPAFYRCVAAHAPARRRRSTRTAASRR
ncbi:hypothetical protein BURPS1710b_0154 [Burkholderia pseudomallei 1710b]|uniref:FAD linked oxidase n=5 Tax=Burkholderia pseudomallei TaxID=28450 RepID=Q3JXY2_BURP1|nr:hypothetical protein BURPS1710b_0154 [Burkholderia pseudomallei 1710b]